MQYWDPVRSMRIDETCGMGTSLGRQAPQTGDLRFLLPPGASCLWAFRGPRAADGGTGGQPRRTSPASELAQLYAERGY